MANGLNGESITDFLMDKNRNVWIASSGGGLFYFNGSLPVGHYSMGQEGLTSSNIFSLCIDDEDRLWIGTDIGINMIEDGRVKYNSHVGMTIANKICNYDASSLLVTGEEGLYLYDKATEEYRLVYHNRKVGFSRDMVICDGLIYVVGIDNGISFVEVIDAKDFTFKTRVKLPTGARVVSFIDAYGSNVVVGTDRGMLCIDDGARSCSLLHMGEFASDFENIVFGDIDSENGTAVFGMQGKGIYSYSFHSKKITMFSNADKLLGDVSREVILANNSIYYAKNSGGFARVNRAKDIFSLDICDDYPREMIVNVFDLEQSDKVLVVTSTKLYFIDLDRCEKQVVSVQGIGPDILIANAFVDSGDGLWLFDSQKNLYGMTYTQGRYVLGKSYKVPCGDGFLYENAEGELSMVSGRTYMHIDKDTNQLLVEDIGYEVAGIAHKGYDGNVYLFGQEGIFQVKGNGSFEKLPVDHTPWSLYCDKNGTLWFDQWNDGIYMYDQKTGAEKKVSDGAGNLMTAVRSISGTGDGDIWICNTENTIRMSTSDFSYVPFPNYGDRSVYVPRALLRVKLPSGEEYFISARVNKLNVVKTSMHENSLDFNVKVDRFFVHGLMRDFIHGEEIELGRKDNTMSFVYSAHSLDFGNMTTYMYKLEGYDKDWVFSSTENYVTYNSLPPGEYEFKVRAKTYDGVWVDAESAFAFSIKQSPWLSKVAIFIYILLGFTVINVVGVTLYKRKSILEALAKEKNEKKMADLINSEKMNFFTTISHEYRTPLSLIYGPAMELERENSLNDHDKELATLIARNASRMLKLTEQLLDFDSKANDTEEHLMVRPTDLSIMIRRVVSNFSYMLDEKKMSINLEIPDGLAVWCDHEKVVRVLTNLISNAIKYSPQDSKVSISTTILNSENAKTLYSLPYSNYSGDYIEIIVADNGIGISEGKISDIFKKYVRLKQRKEDKNSGYGIGLFYAMHLCEIHKGGLRYRPNADCGSVFCLAFPKDKGAYSMQEVFHEDISMTVPEHKRNLVADIPTGDFEILKRRNDEKLRTVIIVDDDNDVRQYISSLFENQFVVESFSNGAMAWERIKTSVPDLVISDVMMPLMDGFTLCREIKSADEICHIPVVLLTAKGDSASQILGFDKGADAYIPKPFDPGVLVAQVCSMIQNRVSLQRVLSETSNVGQVIHGDSVRNDLTSRDKDFIRKFYSVLDENLSNEQYNATMMASSLHMSYSSFFNKVKDLFGMTPQSLVQNYRLNKSLELLKTHEYNVSEVCDMVGYSSASAFSRSFKTKFGFPPSSV